MSQYADSKYYYNVFNGNLIGNNINKYLREASEKIDEVTFNRIVGIGFDNLTDFQKEKVKLAVCYQAEYIFEKGYDAENEDDISNYTVLDISVTKSESAEKTMAEKKKLSSLAYDQIKKTGLACGRM